MRVFESNLFGTEVISLNDLDICFSTIIIPNNTFLYIYLLIFSLRDYLERERETFIKKLN